MFRASKAPSGLCPFNLIKQGGDLLDAVTREIHMYYTYWYCSDKESPLNTVHVPRKVMWHLILENLVLQFIN